MKLTHILIALWLALTSFAAWHLRGHERVVTHPVTIEELS